MRNGNKWSCGHCTYHNFNNTVKCTMCSLPRSPNLIVEPGADIYQLGGCQAVSPTNQLPSRRSNSPISPPQVPKPADLNDEKWNCSFCTYRNYMRAIRCTQCRNTRVSLSDQMSNLILNKSNKMPSPPNSNIKNTGRTVNAIITQGSTPSTNSQTVSLSPNRGNDAGSGGGRGGSPQSQGTVGGVVGAGAERESPGGAGRYSPQGAGGIPQPPVDPKVPNYKWRCLACTYENWPRSNRCVMCASPKSSSPGTQGQHQQNQQHQQPARLATPPPPSGNSKNNNQLINKKNSPPLIPKGIDSSNEHVLPTKVEIISETSNNTEALQQSENNAKNRENINEINKSKRSESQQQLSQAPLQIQQEQLVHQRSNINDNIENSTLSLTVNNPSSGGVRALSGEGGAVALNNYETERLLRQLRRRLREADWAWLNACNGVVEGNYEPVEAYLSAGGDPMRQLTNADVKLLSRPSAFDEGHTLVHLAIRFGREDLLATILSRMDGGGTGVKRVPSYVAPDLATDIRRQISASIRTRKGPFPCQFVVELVTYSLPAEIEELPGSVQEQLLEELLDRDAQKQLEEDSPIINWCLEITDRLGSRLYALWNRTAGDCLLDSVLQSTWGVFDRDNVLRRALADSLAESSQLFYPRWKEYERWQARLLDYYVPDGQVLEEWAELICLASQPGAALEQLHIFVLAHILRRPIVVYGVKCVKSFRGEDLGYARFEGVYLPLLWETSFCWKSPIALGYTRGHFSALVPMEPESPDNLGAGAILDAGESQVVFLPLMTSDAKLLPVHFLTQAEVGCEESLLRQWLEVCVSEGGVLVAQQHLTKKPLNVAQMTEEWLNHYRRLAQMECAGYHRPITTLGGYSSDGDSEEE
ncbi:unnamed protein product, partial [Meganyctiphanes norvegica]